LSGSGVGLGDGWWGGWWEVGGGGWGWGMGGGLLEGRKASKTWMCGEEGSYEGGILPEVNGIKVGGIIWA